MYEINKVIIGVTTLSIKVKLQNKFLKPFPIVISDFFAHKRLRNISLI